MKSKEIFDKSFAKGKINNNYEIYDFKIYNGRPDFSTKVGNNVTPGKYSDLELYCMNMISDEELIRRKIKEYEELKKNNLITQEEFIKRTTAPVEVAREFSNVKRYIKYGQNKERLRDYFTGKVERYSIDYIKEMAEPKDRPLILIIFIEHYYYV